MRAVAFCLMYVAALHWLCLLRAPFFSPPLPVSKTGFWTAYLASVITIHISTGRTTACPRLVPLLAPASANLETVLAEVAAKKSAEYNCSISIAAGALSFHSWPGGGGGSCTYTADGRKVAIDLRNSEVSKSQR